MLFIIVFFFALFCSQNSSAIDLSDIYFLITLTQDRKGGIELSRVEFSEGVIGFM